jgi:hypothetical protein
MDLWTVFFVSLVTGVGVFLVRKAPVIAAEWKEYISYGALVVVVLWLLFNAKEIVAEIKAL